MSIAHRLNRIWYDDAVGQAVLLPFSWLYGRIVAARRGAFASGQRQASRAGAPVIIVGNLSVGGTGKTPVVAWLAWQLGALGRKVGIASRGYGAARAGTQLVVADADWRNVGDEPVLLQRRTGVPVVVDADRVELEAETEVVQAKALERVAAIHLIKALGGGFESPAR